MANRTCLNNLVGLKSLCTSASPAPLFYLDDIEGMTSERLSQLATTRDGSGGALFTFLKESAIRLMLADIDTVIPSNYSIKPELASVCSTCAFSGFFSNATAAGTGIIVKNMSNSRFTSLIIDSLKVKVASTGNFTLVIDDKKTVTPIIQDFISGEELTLVNIGFETTEKQVSIYFTDPTVKMNAITCPAGSTCGC